MEKKSKHLSVQGMHCAACSTRIEKVIGNLEGVERADVNLAAESMELVWDNDVTDYKAISDRVHDLGFELVQEVKETVEHLELAIEGMHCAACSTRIEKVLSGQPGIENVQINLATESGSVVFNPEKISQRKIRATIAGLGFTATAVSKQQDNFTKKRQETARRLAAMKNRLVFSLLLAVPLLLISMGEMVGLPLPNAINPHSHPINFALAQLVLVSSIMFLGRSFYLVGIPALLRGSPNMDSLIAVGTGAAFIYSSWNLIEMFLGGDPHKLAMDLYFESAGVLIALVSLGKYMETRSKSHTSDAIAGLMQLRPETAILLDNNEQREIPAEEIERGDLLLIRTGDRIPVDGTIEKGNSSVDESMLTGESLPVSKQEGDKLIGGTLNKSGVLQMRATEVGQDTMLSRIVRMVQSAQGSKAPIAGMADRISLYFVPTVMALAIITGLAWYFIGGVDFSTALRFFIAVLVIACPCAMGLATPTSIMVGTGRGAQLGVLVKNGEALEKAEKINTVVFDKTGTLTHGRPELTDIIAVDPVNREKELLFYAASLEQSSEHPLAEALLSAAKKEKTELKQPENVEIHTGKGISGTVAGKDLLLGNRHLLADQGVSMPNIDEQSTALSSLGKTVLYLAVDKKLAGLLAVADTMKPEVPQTIAAMKKMGLHPVMLTGDQQQTAKAIAAQAGIDEIIAEVLPDQKASTIVDLQRKGLKTAMVGDGINDAPALARADVGIAMGTGIDIAIETGDIVIMKGNLSGVKTALSLSRAVMKNIRQNLFWAFAYNVVGIPVAAGLLVVFGGPALSPMLAGGAMAMSSVSVVSNALRLRYFKG